jgi:hypothetical protein
MMHQAQPKRSSTRRKSTSARSSRCGIRWVRTLLSTSLDAGVPLREVQEAASHADPRTTMRYDNPRVLHQPGEKPQVTWSPLVPNRLRCPMAQAC